MEEFKPISATTKVISTPMDWAWTPDSFENCLRELKHASEFLSHLNHRILYRGQQDSSWLIDSKIGRSLKKNWLKISPDYDWNPSTRDTIELHRRLVSAVLWKFGHVMRPNPQLLALEKTDQELDSWFEYMKRLQQYPDKEKDLEALPGTPLVDWSLCPDIGLFFANRCRTSSQSGAVFIVDATETGRIEMTIKVEKILRKLEKTLLYPRSPGLPLIFSPLKQTLMLRAHRQSAMYLAHMDLRYDLSEIWRILEQKIRKRILLKVILPIGTDVAIANYLDKKGLDETYVMVKEC